VATQSKKGKKNRKPCLLTSPRLKTQKKKKEKKEKVFSEKWRTKKRDP